MGNPIITWKTIDNIDINNDDIYIVLHHNHIKGGGMFASFVKIEKSEESIKYIPLESCGLVDGAKIIQSNNNINKPIAISEISKVIKYETCSHTCNRCDKVKKK